jgi:hypothetical protein
MMIRRRAPSRLSRRIDTVLTGRRSTTAGSRLSGG